VIDNVHINGVVNHRDKITILLGQRNLAVLTTISWAFLFLKNILILALDATQVLLIWRAVVLLLFSLRRASLYLWSRFVDLESRCVVERSFCMRFAILAFDATDNSKDAAAYKEASKSAKHFPEFLLSHDQLSILVRR
jgi:hypothetical protein